MPSTRTALRRAGSELRTSCVFYLHPWEIDPDQPRQVQAPFRSRLRHYVNLGRTEDRLRRLLRDFAWTRMDRLFLDETEPATAIDRVMADATLAVASAPIVTSAAPVAIRNLARRRRGTVGRLCRVMPRGTFFHLAGWRRVIETAFRHRTYYLMAERDGAVTGVLPLTLVKTRLFGTR